MTSRTLFSRTVGTGPDLVLVHGWGLNADVWDETAEALAEHHRVTVVDLPGYGRSPPAEGEYSLALLADQLAGTVPQRATWLGWSLGGLVCLEMACVRPQQVGRLILVCSSPRFVRAPDWPWAVDATVLEQFAWDLATDFQGTLLRFVALEARGGDHSRQELRALRERVFRQGEPQLRALQGGLDLLRDEDLRPCLADLRCPLLVVLGERDQLVPAAAGEAITALSDKAQLTLIPGAAHAPFMSHRGEFVDAVNSFLAGTVASEAQGVSAC